MGRGKWAMRDPNIRFRGAAMFDEPLFTQTQGTKRHVEGRDVRAMVDCCNAICQVGVGNFVQETQEA